MTIPETMQAAIVPAYGGPDVVQIKTRPVPVPKDREVLIKVEAASVDSADARLRAMNAPQGMGWVMRLAVGIRRPRQPIFGTAASGTVAAIGPSVNRFKPGDAVIAFSGMSMRCHAQYLVLAEDRPIVPKPDAISFEEAAALPFGGTAALDFLKKAGIQSGDRILVIGASGAVGTAMVQLAKHFGAHVTASTSSANTGLAAELGVDAVLDYSVTDYTRDGAQYDIIADTVGASSFRESLAALRPRGRYLAIAGGLRDLLARPRDDKRSIAGVAAERAEDIDFLAGLAARGAYRVIIDQVCPLSDIALAHARVDSKRKRGSVLVKP